MHKFFLVFIVICLTFKIEAQTIDSSNLPLIIINTHNQGIPDDFKISAMMKVVSNGPNQMNHLLDSGNIYTGNIGIEIRGRYSAGLPQKPYGIETRDSSGKNLSVSLLDMPKENDWILLANYNDKSFVRNALAFKMFRDMGHYAPRTMLCEVIVNDSYQGIYNLTEKIKVDKNRLNIDKLNVNQNEGDTLTGGYLFSIDYYEWNNSWAGSYSPPGYSGKVVYFVNNYPKPDEITSKQKSYIQNFVYTIEKNLYSTEYKDPVKGYSSYFDVQSFIDYFIVNEISRNVDGYKKSCFYNKSRDSKGGKIAAGPVWDFDWAWKNIWDCGIFQHTDGSGWAYKILECDPWPTPTGWIPRLMQDPPFVSELKSRYTSLRNNILSNSSIMNYIDSVNNLISNAQVRHYQKWPILGENVGAPELDNIPSTFEGETNKFKNWITTRLNWLDQQMLITSDPIVPGLNNDESFLAIYPNPTSEMLTIDANKSISSISVFSFTGREVLSKTDLNSSKIQISLKSFPPGLYVAKINLKGGLIRINNFVIE